MPRLVINRGEAWEGAVHQALYCLYKQPHKRNKDKIFASRFLKKCQMLPVSSWKGAAFHTQALNRSLWRAKSIPLQEKQTKTKSSHPPSPGGSKTAYQGPVPHLLLYVPKPRAVSPMAPTKVGNVKGSGEKIPAQLLAQIMTGISPGHMGDLQGQIRWKREKWELRGIRIFAQNSRGGRGGTNIAFGRHLWQPSLFFLFCLF